MPATALPVLVYLGPPGTGKSYAAKRVVQRYRDHGRFVLAHDITGEWSKRADVLVSSHELALIGWRELPRRSVIVVDEAALALPHSIGPGHFIYDALTKGRHREYVLVLVTQRAADVNRVATAHATRIQVFRTHEPRDLAWLKARGFNPDELQQLGQYKSKTWTPQRGVR